MQENSQPKAENQTVEPGLCKGISTPEAEAYARGWRDGTKHMLDMLQPKPVTAATVLRVEELVGMGSNAWDMVEPKELISACVMAVTEAEGRPCCDSPGKEKCMQCQEIEPRP